MGIDLENIAYIATISSAIFVATQAYLFKKDYKVRNAVSSTEKAINLSQYYKDNILSNTSYLFSLFRAIGIEEKLRKIDFLQLVEFDEEELGELLSEKDIEEIEEKLNNIDVNLLIRARNLLNNSTKDEYIESNLLSLSQRMLNSIDESAATKVEGDVNKFINVKAKKVKTEVLMEMKTTLYKDEFIDVVSNTLNNMEYFAMHFNHNIADEEVVYQSLHQSYLRLVKMLYYYIAKQNKSGKDKYFTNIIALYTSWNKRYNEKCNQEKMINRSIVHNKKRIKK